MNKTLKITISILLSAAFFYLFIKDVNKIPLVRNSGLHQGSGQHAGRVLFVADVENFEIGDTFTLSSDKIPQKLTCRVAEITTYPDLRQTPYIVTEEPIQTELLLDDNPVIHFPRLQRALLRANYWWILPALAATVLALIIRAYRWKFFLNDFSRIKFQSLWRSVCVGYMANNVLPFRIGEIVRAWFLARKENRRTSEIFGTIVMERIFDILSILILYVLFVFYFAAQESVNLPEEMVYGAWIMAIIALGALGFLILLKCRTQIVRRILNYFLNIIPDTAAKKANQMIDAFVEGLWIINSWKCIVVTFSLSMLIWLILAFAYLYVFFAVGIDGTLVLSLFLIVALAFAVSIPSAPGFIGTFHWVGQQVLLLMGLRGNIEAYVLMAHLLAYIPVVVLGLFYLSLENISWKELKTSAMKLSESDTIVP
jgi:glycosyltransferase 2 family protein